MVPEQRFHRGGDAVVASGPGFGRVERDILGLHTCQYDVHSEIVTGN
jgi:hypothetical protein